MALVLTASVVASAQNYVLMPDSTNNRLVAFDPVNGSVVNSNLFGLAGGTPISAIQVGNEIWVTEQIGDRVSRWDWSGNALGSITGLDNVRGASLIGNTVYVTNAGTANGAPGNAVLSYDTSGNLLGVFSTTGLAPSPFYVMDHNGTLLVSSSSGNDDVHRFTTGGTSLGTFYNGTRSFGEQMAIAPNGDIWIGWFSSNVVTRHDPTTGAELSSFSASSVRGVYQLANGNVLWSNSTSVNVWDPNTNQSTLVYSGGGRFFSQAVVPEPASMVALGAGLLALARRRRRK